MFQKNDQNGALKSGSGATIIASGTVFTGNIHSSHDIRIDGRVIGNIECSSKIVIGLSGEVDGNLCCGQCDVIGQVRGDIRASELLVLREKAGVHGNLQTRMLQVEQGVTFNGNCQMGTEVLITEPLPAIDNSRPEKRKLQHAN